MALTVNSGAGTSTSPNEKMFEPRYLRSPSGVVSWSVSTEKDGMAMITRIRIGTTVHTTSTGGVVSRLRRHGVRLGIEADHHRDKQDQRQHRDADSDPHKRTVVEGADGIHDWRHGGLQPDLARQGVPEHFLLAECNGRQRGHRGACKDSHGTQVFAGHYNPLG